MVRSKVGNCDEVTVIIDEQATRTIDQTIRWRGIAQSLQQIGGIRHAALTRVGQDLPRKVEEGVRCRFEFVGERGIDEKLAGIVGEAVENHV